MANMLVGGKTPILSCAELYGLGFEMIVHGTTLIKRVAHTLQQTLDALRNDKLDCSSNQFLTLDEFMDLVDSARWIDFEQYR